MAQITGGSRPVEIPGIWGEILVIFGPSLQSDRTFLQTCDDLKNAALQPDLADASSQDDGEQKPKTEGSVQVKMGQFTA